MYVVDCSTGQIDNVGDDPIIEGVRLSDFRRVQRLLNRNRDRQIYEVRSALLVRPGDASANQCLQLQGGNVLGLKIARDRQAIHYLSRL